jgi:shikimate kinase
MTEQKRVGRTAIHAVVVLGLMGSGKTTVGRLLAGLLGWRFSDSDAEIEGTTGHDVRDLLELEGAPAMHAREADQLLHALSSEAPVVVGAAASVIDDSACRARLASGDVIVVWLRASPATLATRFRSSARRPSYGQDPAVFLAEQARVRYPLYEALGPLTIDVDAMSPQQAADTAGDMVQARLTAPD